MKRTQIVVKQIPLATWFPPDDPLAAAVARLCILREDFYLEGLGFAAEVLPELDGNGETWRRLYFLRQAVRTLVEAKNAMMMLNQNREFKNAVDNAGPGFKKAVQEFQKIVEDARVDEVRNVLGGHVLHKAVMKCLDSLKTGVQALAIFGSTHKDTHYRFTADLVVGILNQTDCQSQEINRVAPVAESLLSGLMTAVDHIFTAYAEARRLM